MNIPATKDWFRARAGWFLLTAFGLGCFGFGAALTMIAVRSECAASMAASSEGYRAALAAKDQLILQLGATASRAVGQAASAVGQAADAAASAADSAASVADATAAKSKADTKALKELK